MVIPDKFTHPVDALEFSCIADALRKDSLSGTSATVEEYENVLAETFQSKHCVALNSGTAALHASLYVNGVAVGDEVIVPALSPIPTILPILAVGAKPIFVDCASTTDINYDIASLNLSITDKTKAIIALPLWGYPLDIEPLKKICDQYSIPLIEDACQAHFTSHGFSLAGVGKHLGCFSTHDRKVISTGEGGFILTHDEAMADNIRRFARLGGMKGEFYGPNFKLSGIQAALGMARVKRAESNVRMRRDNANYITKRLDNKKWREMKFSTGNPNYYCLVVFPEYGDSYAIQETLGKSGLRSDFITYGAEQYRRPLFGDQITIRPNASSLIKKAVTIPVHPGIARETCDEIISILNGVDF
jgi:perosamine synthetase